MLLVILGVKKISQNESSYFSDVKEALNSKALVSSLLQKLLDLELENFKPFPNGVLAIKVLVWMRN